MRDRPTSRALTEGVSGMILTDMVPEVVLGDGVWRDLHRSWPTMNGITRSLVYSVMRETMRTKEVAVAAPWTYYIFSRRVLWNVEG